MFSLIISPDDNEYIYNPLNVVKTMDSALNEIEETSSLKF